MKEPVLVTGTGGPAGGSVIRYLKKRGFNTVGTDMREVASGADRFYLVPPALEPAYTERLLGIIRKERPSLFIPTVTEELHTVALLREAIEREGCAVFISRPDAVSIANDKLATARFMERAGVPVPMTFDGASDRRRILEETGLPVLVKPKFSRGGRGVRVYYDEEAFLADTRKEVVIQEFVPGPEYDANIFVEPGAGVTASVLLRKTELKDGIVGNALKVERVQEKRVEDVALEAASHLGLTGPLNFDIRLRSDSTPVLLEINARVGGNILKATEVLDALIEGWKKGGIKRCVL